MPTPSHQQRRLARRVAIDAWKAGKRDDESLASRFNSDPRITKLDPATIILLIKIAITLWQWWKARKIENPTVQPMQGEPTE